MYQNQTVVITGASRGIGRDLCAHFLAQRGHVIGVSRSPAALEHENYRHFSLDVSDEPSVKALFQTIRTSSKSVEILINNAGVLTSQYTLLMPLAPVEEMMRTNFLGSFLMSRECAKLMLQRRFGRIINISSMAVPLSPAGDAVYSATKSALTQFSRVFAKEVGDYHITCNVLGISAIETEMMAKIPKNKLDAIINSLPVKRFATLQDITNTIDFFANRQSSGITGQVLYLGGVF